MRPAAFAVRPHAPGGQSMFAQVFIERALGVSQAFLTMQLISGKLSLSCMQISGWADASGAGGPAVWASVFAVNDVWMRSR